MEAGELNVGDEIIIIGPTTGAIPMTVKEIRVDLKPVPRAVKGDRFSIQVDEKNPPQRQALCVVGFRKAPRRQATSRQIKRYSSH